MALPAIKQVFVVFPCHNEEEGLEKLLSRFKRVMAITKLPFTFVVVNDGSTDRTQYVAESFFPELSLHVISFEKNRGVASVFNAAFEFLMHRLNEHDIVITIDSDNTMSPFIIVDMLKEMAVADIVVASRFINGGKMIGAGYRAWLSYGASWLMQWRIGIPNLTDYSIFFRAYRAPIIQKLHDFYQGRSVSGKGFSCMANLLIRAWYLFPNLKVKEVPLVLRYDLKESGSKVKIFSTIVGYLKLAFLHRQHVEVEDIQQFQQSTEAISVRTAGSSS